MSDGGDVAQGDVACEDSAPARQLSLTTATQLVIASMVGTGVFTTSGYFLADIPSAPANLLGWALGGLLALCGALSYAELSAALPCNGGEVALLSRIYHPALGFVAGVIGIVVGFAAPIAAAAIAFGDYAAQAIPGLSENWGSALGVVAIALSAAAHCVGVKSGARAQDVITGIKVVLVAAVGVWLFAMGDPSRLSVAEVSMGEALSDPAFAVGLVYVAFAYTGWNAASYVAGETSDPARQVPRALLGGTLIVTLLYLLLNAAFLVAAPMDALAGETEIAAVAAIHAAGPTAGRILSAVIAVGLLSTTGAMTMTGARMAEALAEDRPRLRGLLRTHPDSPPRMAIALQATLACTMALSATFDALLIYAGVTLTASAMLTTLGVFVLRRNEPELERPYRTWGYPLTPLLFAALSVWMIAATVIEKPVVAAVALGTVVSAYGVYRWVER